MSKTIGSVHGFTVMASSGGVELHGESVANPKDRAITITPDEACELAAVLIKASSQAVVMAAVAGRGEEPYR